MTAMSHRLERAAAVVAVLALAVWVGGIVVLGACAAPLVFRIVPAPLSGEAMGAVFRRFDAIAISSGVIVLGCEAVRIWARRREPTVSEKVRALLAVVGAAAAIYGGTQVSPALVALHAAGAVRAFGLDGAELERLHKIAEALAKFEVAAGICLLALHITTLENAEPRTS